MKKIGLVFGLVVCYLLINSCAMASGNSVNNQINNSVLSAPNNSFAQEAGVDLTIVKRGLWSLQDKFKNKSIESYFIKLMDNQLEYSIDKNQEEFIKQSVSRNGEVKISINTYRLQYYSEYESDILITASTAVLALYNDPGFNNEELTNMFFKFIQSYENTNISGILNSQWFVYKYITLTNNGIIIIGPN